MKIKDFVQGGQFWNLMKHFQLQKQGEDSKIVLPEGTKVKFNLDKILSQPDFLQSNPKFRDFIYNNKDNIFTIEYDKDHDSTSCLVCLEEDNTVPKWLFFNGYFDVVE